MDEDEQGKGEPVDAAPEEHKPPAAEDKPEEPAQAAPRKTENESDRQKRYRESAERRQYSTPNQIIIECLKKLFDDNEMRELCLARFYELYQDLDEDDKKKSRLIERLVYYCIQRSMEYELWGYVQETRPLRYNEFFSKWENARKSSFKNLAYSYGGESGQSARQSPPDSDSGGGNHVLTYEDRTAIARWFHEELDSGERSMVLAVALFQGINRKHMASISEEIEQRLFKKT
jgi:hypothetical protein